MITLEIIPKSKDSEEPKEEIKKLIKNLELLKTNKSQLGFLKLLSIVFITLKLCRVIDWSWWFVLAPLWINIAIFIVVIVVFIALGMLKLVTVPSKSSIKK